MQRTLPFFGLGTAAPTDTSQFHEQGEVVWNSTPAVGQALGWMCVTEGYPGTWVSLGQNKAVGLTTMAAGGTISSYSRYVKVNDAGTVVLGATSLFPSGTPITIRADAASVTVSPTGAQIDAAAAATLAANGKTTILHNGGTLWYTVA